MSDYENDFEDNEQIVDVKAVAQRRENIRRQKMSLTGPPTIEELAFSQIKKGYFKPKKSMAQIARLLSLAALCDVSEAGMMKADNRTKKAEDSFRSFVRLWCAREPPFDSVDFADDFVQPLFDGERGGWFTPGSIFASTTPSDSKATRVRESKYILTYGKATRASLHVLTDFFDRYLENGQVPTGRTMSDILELTRKCAYLSRKPSAKKAESASASPEDGDGEEIFDSQARYSMAELDAEYVPESYRPSAWLAFVFYGPYGQRYFSTDTLPILAEDEDLQDACAKSRSKRKNDEEEERRSKLKLKRDQVTPPRPVELLLEHYKQVSDRRQRESERESECNLLFKLLGQLNADIACESDEEEKQELKRQKKVSKARLELLMSSETPKEDSPNLPNSPIQLPVPDKPFSSEKVPRSQVPSSEPSPSTTSAVKKRVRRTKSEIERGLSTTQVKALRDSMQSQENEFPNEPSHLSHASSPT